MIAYKSCPYLVTAQHVAYALGDDPWSLRVNKADGTSDVIAVDPIRDHELIRWHTLSKEVADVAVTRLPVKIENWDQKYIPEEFFTNVAEQGNAYDIGIGDVCYAVGLFYVLTGRNRNIPIVHTGNIALEPGIEQIPIGDWTKPKGAPLIDVDAYLVEASNLAGLSGAPVFVRPTCELDFNPLMNVVGVMLQKRVRLLGIWQGSWDGEMAGAAGKGRPRGIRVPVGMGIVTPCSKLVELLESEEVTKERDGWLASAEAAKAPVAD